MSEQTIENFVDEINQAVKIMYSKGFSSKRVSETTHYVFADSENPLIIFKEAEKVLEINSSYLPFPKEIDILISQAKQAGFRTRKVCGLNISGEAEEGKY